MPPDSRSDTALGPVVHPDDSNPTHPAWPDTTTRRNRNDPQTKRLTLTCSFGAPFAHMTRGGVPPGFRKSNCRAIRAKDTLDAGLRASQRRAWRHFPGPVRGGPGNEALGHFDGNAGLRQAGKDHADGVNRNTVRPY